MLSMSIIIIGAAHQRPLSVNKELDLFSTVSGQWQEWCLFAHDGQQRSNRSLKKMTTQKAICATCIRELLHLVRRASVCFIHRAVNWLPRGRVRRRPSSTRKSTARSPVRGSDGEAYQLARAPSWNAKSQPASRVLCWASPSSSFLSAGDDV
jgi:hypothetical protein